MPARGTGAEQREVTRDLRHRHGDDLERARQLDQRIAVRLGLEAVQRRADLLEPRLRLQRAADLRRELRVGVQAGAGRRPAERDLADVDQRRLDALAAERDLGGVARELCAERDGYRVHQVRSPGLDDLAERAALLRERLLELSERGQRPVDGDVERGQVDRRREHVVRRLAHVDVIVGMRAGQLPDDLVGVHVRRRARSGLEDVDRELPVVRPGGDLVGRLRDRLGELGVEQTEFAVRAGGGALDAPEPVDDLGRDGLARDREVADRLGGLAAVQTLAGHQIAAPCWGRLEVGLTL